MRNQTVLLTAMLLLNGCNIDSLQLGSIVKDRDWNTRFTNNCTLPRHDSFRWVSEGNRRYARFALSDKDKGGCVTDKVARHSAPYWERVELKQAGSLKRNQKYTIDSTLRFSKGFGGERETFFQIHAYNNSCKQAYPPLMLEFDNTHTDTGVLTLLALNSSRRHIGYRSDVNIEDTLGKWIDLKLILDTSEESSVTVLIDEEVIYSDIPIWIEPCGMPHIKFGIYRPGSLSGNSKSIVDVDLMLLSGE